MSLNDVLPEVRTWSHADKVSLMEFLVRELEQEATTVIEPGKVYPVWSPDTAFSAADELLKALEKDKGAS